MALALRESTVFFISTTTLMVNYKSDLKRTPSFIAGKAEQIFFEAPVRVFVFVFCRKNNFRCSKVGKKNQNNICISHSDAVLTQNQSFKKRKSQLESPLTRPINVDRFLIWDLL